jgi:HAD superfamily hydrolase (TIGR01509 family)
MKMSEQLWDLQREFNDKFWATKGGWPKGDEARTIASKDFAVHIMRELGEVLSEMNSKMHRIENKPLDRTNVLEELIDVTKFTYGFMQLWGFSFKEFEEEFKRKSMVVEQRFAQEQQFAKLRNDPVVIVDIDGVLTDYPNCYYEWLGTNHFEGKNAHYVKSYLDTLPLRDREELKNKYRRSGAKATLKLVPGAREMLQLLKRELKVVFLTNRPYADFYRIYPDTLEWARTHALPYDAILWARDKGLEAIKHFGNVAFAIDDSDENIRNLKKAGITTVKIDNDDEVKCTYTFARFLQEQTRDGKLLVNAGHEWNSLLGMEVTR